MPEHEMSTASASPDNDNPFSPNAYVRADPKPILIELE